MAERVSWERGEAPGSSCGYSVRFESVLPRPHASILFCTVGEWLRQREHLWGLPLSWTSLKSSYSTSVMSARALGPEEDSSVFGFKHICFADHQQSRIPPENRLAVFNLIEEVDF